MSTYYSWLKNLFLDVVHNEQMAVLFSAIVVLFSIAAISGIFHLILRSALRGVFSRIVKRTRFEWDDILFKNRVFNVLAHIAPVLIIRWAANFAGNDIGWMAGALLGIAKIYLIIVLIAVFNRLLSSSLDIYQTYPFSKARPIKGYIQLMKLLLYFIGGIFLVSVLISKSPGRLFTGLGAMAAVLLFVFKDAILGFIASIQLAANKMVKPGDWISLPSYNADGTVEDISLTSVKVQNWDKTITTIPTYALVSGSMTNWIGMEESGGRRIKRSINIDMTTVRFADTELLEHLREFSLIREYVERKEKEIKEYNQAKQLDDRDYVSGRKQTNLGIFRKYLEAYLHNHPMVHDEMTFLIRHLQPTEKGIPVEIYVFSKDQRWANYEELQADIFDHILAVLPEFGLRVFQNPSGEDFRNLKQVNNNEA
ncbi:mechanosensitive ion channel family protein [Prolixibacter sp. SD074]|jgi:miniconductance mechanosensitive channel|uniref:mechanosensitive ion channel family protein n=1 Tax=Prolixibacter sp. SD074 TaxID=2652391 RepID=UPI001E2A133E|nr:mechanosensitive ion channel domain-containing protein [Prolixibacter sp. SD074]